MITNAKLVSYTTPARPTARGDRVDGETTAYAAGVRVLVDRPTRSQSGGGGDLLAEIVARLFAPVTLQPVPKVDGRLSFVRDNGPGVETLQVAAVTDHRHGVQSHFEILLRAVR